MGIAHEIHSTLLRWRAARVDLFHGLSRMGPLQRGPDIMGRLCVRRAHARDSGPRLVGPEGARGL